MVRPGSVYGASSSEVTGRVGIGTFGLFLHLGGSNTIPFTYVENCAEAIVLAGLVKGVDGEVFNVVDDDLPSSRQFLRQYKKNVRRFKSVYVPHVVSHALCYLWEKYSQWSKGQLPPAFNRRRWYAEWKKTRYSNEKLKRRTGLDAKVSTERDCADISTVAGRVSGMLKVAIVGCGKIADAHASQIQRMEGCEIVGVCDREPLMAQAALRAIPGQSLLHRSGGTCERGPAGRRPHHDAAGKSLRDCQILPRARAVTYMLRSPLPLMREEAQRLVDLANKKGLKLTVGHNYQFSHVARRMRALVESGYLGGPPVHMESYYGYDLGDPSYARALLGDKQHWVRRLPGKLLHNIISHGIARIAEFLTSDDPQVIAMAL